MIRVLRLIEYEFDDYEMMEDHKAKCQTPWDGIKKVTASGYTFTLRSTSLEAYEPDRHTYSFAKSLLHYATHIPDCIYKTEHGVVGCTCGLDDLKERFEEAKDE